MLLILPNEGEEFAPAGVGENANEEQLEVDENGELAGPDQVADVHGCPSGLLKKWYCFYTNANYGGRRLQFSSTCSDFASNWGFDNQTSSWVNTNTALHLNVRLRLGIRAVDHAGTLAKFERWRGQQ